MTSFDERNQAFLAEMGVGPLWVKRDRPAASAVTDDTPAESAAALQEDTSALTPILPLQSLLPAEKAMNETIAGMDWMQLKAAVSGCTRCGLCQTRTQTVFGVGDPIAKWLFVGEGPGRNEDLQGEPFVGPAGKLLDNMLAAIDLRRGTNAYIANIVKCRPTGADKRDRPPTSEEAAACLPYLQRQIELIQPTVIVALGKTAALSLLGLDPDTAVSALRGKVHRYAGLPLIVTYHPAYLLRNPSDKRKSWADLCLAMNTYAASGA
jgi:DNA polymerase